MKKIAIVWLALLVSGCAFGKLEDAANEIEETLDDLHTAECMRACTDTAEVCLDEANLTCVDGCEVLESNCDADEKDCVDTNKTACANLSGPSYTNCMDQVRTSCDGDCNGKTSDCNQGCAELAQDCLTTDQNCVADCVQELEDSLGGISL